MLEHGDFSGVLLSLDSRLGGATSRCLRRSPEGDELVDLQRVDGGRGEDGHAVEGHAEVAGEGLDKGIAIAVLRAAHDGDVAGAPVGIRILARAEIALAGGVLQRTVELQIADQGTVLGC